MSLRARVRSGLFWAGGARLLSQIVTWAVTIVVIRLLSPSDYGLLAMATVFMSCLTMFAEVGLGSALIQAQELDEPTLRRIFGAVILVDLGLFVLQLSVAPLVAHLFDEERLVTIIRVLALQFPLMIFVVIPSAMLSRSLKFKHQSLISLASAVLGSLSSLLLAYSGYGVWALVMSSLVVSVCNAVLFNWVAPFLKWPNFSLNGMRGLITFGGQVTLGRALWLLYTQADVFIVGKLLGKELLGFYSISMHLASLPVQKVTSVINSVAYPAFASARQDTAQSASHVLKAIRILSFVAFPVLWGISSVSSELVTNLLGPQWDPAVLPLTVLALIMPLRVVSNFLPNATDARGRADIGVTNLVVTNLVMLPAFAIGSRWGLLGVSIAWGCIWPIVFLANLGRSLPVVSLRVTDVLRAMAPAAFCGLGMYGAVWGAREFMSAGLQGVHQLLVPVATGVVVYALLAATINMRVCKEVIELLRR